MLAGSQHFLLYPFFAKNKRVTLPFKLLNFNPYLFSPGSF
jgi:hypothetical protein